MAQVPIAIRELLRVVPLILMYSGMLSFLVSCLEIVLPQAKPLRVGMGRYAGSCGLPIQMDRACAAKPDTAAKFRSGEPQNVAQVPEQRHFRWTTERMLSYVHFKLNHFSAIAQDVIDAGSRPPIAVGTQMRTFFHLQNDRRKILLRSFVRLPRIDLKSSTRCGHSRADSSGELENQPKILVH